MKKRIVVKDEIFADFLIKNKDNHNISASPKVIMDRCRVEKEPTNWEELKNLCNENNLEILADIIYTNALSFYKNGYVKDNENSIVAVNRTPQQMWNIIKNLIKEK